MRDTLGSPGNNRLTATENKELIIRNTIAGLVKALPVIRQRPSGERKTASTKR